MILTYLEVSFISTGFSLIHRAEMIIPAIVVRSVRRIIGIRTEREKAPVHRCGTRTILFVTAVDAPRRSASHAGGKTEHPRFPRKRARN